jgi:hypothetical protein
MFRFAHMSTLLAGLLMGSAAASAIQLPDVALIKTPINAPKGRVRRASGVKGKTTYFAKHSSTRQQARYARQIAAGQLDFSASTR